MRFNISQAVVAGGPATGLGDDVGQDDRGGILILDAVGDRPAARVPELEPEVIATVGRGVAVG
jgi:hypothetical protein